jgi:hypothetical protein
MRITAFGPSGSVSKRYGSADPDPHQNVTDPQHWLVIFSDTLFFIYIEEKKNKRILSFRPCSKNILKSFILKIAKLT